MITCGLAAAGGLFWYMGGMAVLEVRRAEEVQNSNLTSTASGRSSKKSRASHKPSHKSLSKSAVEVGENLDRTLTRIGEINAETSSKDHYQTFLNLREILRNDPESVGRLRSMDLYREPETAAEKRQISLIYGALAQSEQKDAWPLLRDGLELGVGETIGFQAVSAVADFAPFAPNEAFDNLLKVSEQHGVEYVRNSAFLALGSLASAKEVFADRFRPLMLKRFSELQITDPWSKIDVTLTAAGNHGDESYIPWIKGFASHPNESVRARSFYALRKLPKQSRTSTATHQLIDWLKDRTAEESSAYVQLAGLKALMEQDLMPAEKTDVSSANIATNSELVIKAIGVVARQAKSQEVLATAVRYLSHLHSDSPQAVQLELQHLKTVVKDPLVLLMIEQHLGLGTHESQ